MCYPEAHGLIADTLVPARQFDSLDIPSRLKSSLAVPCPSLQSPFSLDDYILSPHLSNKTDFCCLGPGFLTITNTNNKQKRQVNESSQEEKHVS